MFIFELRPSLELDSNINLFTNSFKKVRLIVFYFIISNHHASSALSKIGSSEQGSSNEIRDGRLQVKLHEKK